MAGRGPDEQRLVQLNDGTTRVWNGERWGGRYLFIGPRPGKILFHSCEAKGWEEASNDARLRWKQREGIRRDSWYGEDGNYTLPQPPPPEKPK